MRLLLFIILFIYAFAKAYSQEISPQTYIVDFLSIYSYVGIDYNNKEVTGGVLVTFKMLQDANELYLDAKDMEVEDKTEDVFIRATDSTIVFNGEFKKGQQYDVNFIYKATPKQALYFVNNKGNSQVWTQGQGKYTSYWLPSLDDMNDKIRFNLYFEYDDYNISRIASGTISDSGTQYSGHFVEYDTQKPISSYLLALVVGNYNKKTETSTSGIPLEYYYYPQDSLKVTPTYRYSKQFFDFLEKEIGVPYPWEVYRQVPVKDFLYAGMENASCTIFSDNFMVDEIGFVDQKYVNVNAHELAHQWFGDLVTETKSDHHWLHEGFATYYALLAERELFGDDYFYFKLYESAEQLRELSDSGKGQKLVNAGGSSLTYYQKGAWAVHILQEKIGEEPFKKAVASYLKKYAFKNVTTDDFMNEVAQFTDVDLTDFKKNWLNQSAFQSQDALESLKKSLFMQQYFQLQSGRAVPLESKFAQLVDAIESGNDYLGQEAVYQLSGEDSRATLPAYKRAMASSNTVIRQAIATSVENVNEALEGDFYELLDDSSYVTREQALIKLWVYYQNKQSSSSQVALLNKMDSQFGFSDGNIRTLWLTLSLATPGYKPETSFDRYQELIAYTSPEQPFALRQNAFQYLRQLDSFEKISLENLVEACVHNVWRFRESARKLLDEQMKKTKNKAILTDLSSTMKPKELSYLKRIGVL